MKNRLFWRLFWAFMATLILTVGVLSGLVVIMVRSERQQALESEVLMQARDMALLMRQEGHISWMWRPNTQIALSGVVREKIGEIQGTYEASIWIVNATGSLLVIGDAETTQDHINDENVVTQLRSVLSGREIRVQGLIPELGEDIVTIGVPLAAADGYVYGALLMHISTSRLRVDYSDMIRNAGIAASIAMILGSFLAYFISSRQTRPMKQIQEAVREFSGGNLDRRVDIRGGDEMAQLGSSINRMAQELSTLEESRRSFVANVSHELRSPLTCIQGYVQGMLDGTIPRDDADRYLNIVLSETKRLTKLVNELLDLSCFESGKIPLTKTVFDVNQLIALELFSFEGRIEEKEIDVQVNFASDQFYVLADADRIRQVVTNLIDNAVKFLRTGGHLIVDTRDEGGKCAVSISNDGPQIPPDDLPYIFDRFYKADKARTSGNGTGLGLSIAKLIITQHDETISVNSGPGLTRFLFTLEKAEAPQHAGKEENR